MFRHAPLSVGDQLRFALLALIALVVALAIAGCYASVDGPQWIRVGNMLCDPRSRVPVRVHGTVPVDSVVAYAICIPL